MFLSGSCKQKSKELYEYVNPFIGTDAHGHTFPGACSPFGMVQLSPDTRLTGWDGCGGYHYSDSVIFGFSHTHLSGTGISDYGDILLMPNTGKGYFDNGAKSQDNYTSEFSHEDEKAEAGYYAVKLLKNEIEVELTATERCGFQKYTYPFGSQTPHIVVDLEHRDDLLDANLQVINNNEIIGFRQSKAWAKSQFTYFHISFSDPIVNVQYLKWKSDTTKYSKAIVYFASNSNDILVKTGLSSVDLKGAKANLDSELSSWDFTEVKKQVQKKWNKALSKIKVQGGTEDEKSIFYTSLYHTMIAPNIFSDADGRYRSMNGSILRSNDKTYTVFSLWDTFRSTHPLFSLIERKRTLSFIQTFLKHFNEGGRLPVWELSANETDCMIGYHAVSVITDAYMKGIKDFDHELALEAMLFSAQRKEQGLEAYQSKHFIEMDDNPESVSKTLEYAYDDWCIAQFAKQIGKDSIAEIYYQRSKYYQNIFDSETKFMRARINGSWFSPFQPNEVNFNYTEANAWQYSLFVPHDVKGLAEIMGGPKGLENYLDSLFLTSSDLGGHEQADITGLIGQYAHGNEPSHHLPYLYLYCGKAWKTQEMVRRIMSEMYKNTASGLIGNEDCGQMSSWYVLSSIGLYSLCPGDDYFVIGSPLFNEVQLNLETGKFLKIIAKNNSKKNKYIRSILWNGKKINRYYLLADEILSGGTLELEMSSEPLKDITSLLDKSQVKSEKFVKSPVFKSKQMSFENEFFIEFYKADSIYYSLDSIHWSLYNQSIRMSETTTCWAYNQKNNLKSPIIKRKWNKIDARIKIKLKTNFADRYAAGGEKALIDGIEGGNDYRTGLWQGYQGQDLSLIIDLGEVKTIQEIKIRFLQDQKSWIWLPNRVQISMAEVENQYNQYVELNHSIPLDSTGTIVYPFLVDSKRKMRFIKINAINAGDCPYWHPGFGGKSWLFADEIFIQ
jgi:predicted alpha-1,2-mannosidase